jgi:hypothetical protein
MTTTPPPLLLQSSMALVILLVFKVIPSGFAPYLVIKKESFLKTGCLTTGSLLLCAKTEKTETKNQKKKITLFIIPVN